MRRTTGVATIAIALVLTALVAVRRSDPERSDPERRRLEAHFDSVLVELEARDVSHLGPEQRAARTQLIAWLTNYRNGGVFPHNTDFPDRAVPYFRDRRGVLCAMAYLVDRSGRRDIVDDVARTANNAFIPELAHRADLTAWLDSTGLDVREAARIQPTYGGTPSIVTERRSPERVFGSIAFTAAAVTSVFLNLDGHRPSPSRQWRGALALASGAGAIGFGAAAMDVCCTGARAVGAVAVVAGATALGIGTARLLGMGDSAAVRRTGGSSVKRAIAGAAFAPYWSPGPAGGAGILVRITP